MAIQTPRRVPCHKRYGLPCFLGGFGCRFPGVLRCGFDTLCAACPCCFCILLFNLLFLPEAGKGIAR